MASNNVAKSPQNLMVSHDTPKPARRAGAASLPWLHSPLEITPHKTGVVGDGLMPAVRALVSMAAQGGGAVTRNGVQHFDMRPVQPTPASFHEAGAAGAHNVSPLDGWLGHLLTRRTRPLSVCAVRPAACCLQEAGAAGEHNVSHLDGWLVHLLTRRTRPLSVGAEEETVSSSSGLATAFRCRWDKCR